ncbi:hypothetical protein TIFTF001_049669 [Ficus carica]|uniref:Retrotransposon gag domain-containing protein n=1 Tax=Ficus carica TaxID=3494 RepID=A0AA87Z6X0_FICCA|nr:hypothetical protein TIFTF001_049669 [Ficus carica]
MAQLRQDQQRGRGQVENEGWQSLKWKSPLIHRLHNQRKIEEFKQLQIMSPCLTENEKVKCASYCLMDDARIWWEGIKEHYDEFNNFRQGNLSVTEAAVETSTVVTGIHYDTTLWGSDDVHSLATSSANENC